jgi:uncharacterized protein (TIGR00730 family)
MNPPKAYKNPHFLMSKEARSVRILCEYLEPRSRMERNEVHRAIVFFGSARVRPPQQPGTEVSAPGKRRTRRAIAPDYYGLAADLAERLAQWTTEHHPPKSRYYLCTGGGPGIMQAVHEGAARVDRKLNVGFNISLPHEQHGNPFVESQNAFEFHYFFMRKFWFLNLAEAFVAFPGGFGTMDELFELLTLMQTGKASRMPVVLFGAEFWRKTVNFPALVAQGYIDAEDAQLFRYADDVDEAWTQLTRALEAA